MDGSQSSQAASIHGQPLQKTHPPCEALAGFCSPAPALAGVQLSVTLDLQAVVIHLMWMLGLKHNTIHTQRWRHENKTQSYLGLQSSLN